MVTIPDQHCLTNSRIKSTISRLFRETHRQPPTVDLAVIFMGTTIILILEAGEEQQATITTIMECNIPVGGDNYNIFNLFECIFETKIGCIFDFS